MSLIDLTRALKHMAGKHPQKTHAGSKGVGVDNSGKSGVSDAIVMSALSKANLPVSKSSNVVRRHGAAARNVATKGFYIEKFGDIRKLRFTSPSKKDKESEWLEKGAKALNDSGISVTYAKKTVGPMNVEVTDYIID